MGARGRAQRAPGATASCRGLAALDPGHPTRVLRICLGDQFARPEGTDEPGHSTLAGRDRTPRRILPGRLAGAEKWWDPPTEIGAPLAPRCRIAPGRAYR